MSESREPLPGSLWTLLGCQAMMVAGLALAYPFFALYLHRERGLSMGLVGLALSAMLASTAVAQALGGELSDLRGAKAVMEAALASRAFFAGAMAWAIHAQAPVPVLIGLLISGGFCGNFFDPGIRSWIAERFPAPRRAALYGYQRVAINLGFGIGPAVGGIMIARSYACLFAASAALCAGCWALVHWGLRNEAAARSHERFDVRAIASAAGDRRFLAFCGYTVVISMVMAQLVASLSVHAVSYAGLSERQVGLLFALNGLLVTVLQLHVIRRARGRKLTAALAAGCLLYAAGYGSVGLARGFLAMALAVAVVTLGEAFVSPSLSTIAANIAPVKLRGRYVGVHGLSSQIGSALGPLLGGLGLQYLSPRRPALPWALVSALALIAAVGFSRFGKRLDCEEQGLAGIAALRPVPLEV